MQDFLEKAKTPNKVKEAELSLSPLLLSPNRNGVVQIKMLELISKRRTKTKLNFSILSLQKGRDSSNRHIHQKLSGNKPNLHHWSP